MIKTTFSTVALLVLAGCQRQEPAASPPVAGTEPTPVGEAQPAAPTAPVAALPPATPDERGKLVQSCWSAFNAKDWAKFSTCYAEDATTEQVNMGFPVFKGQNEIIEKSAQATATALPDVTGESQLTLVNGGTSSPSCC